MGNLSIKSGLKLATLDSNMQKNIYDNYNDVLKNKKIKDLNINLDKDEIITQLKNLTNKFVPVTVKIPLVLEDEFKIYIDNWLKTHQKISS